MKFDPFRDINSTSITAIYNVFGAFLLLIFSDLIVIFFMFCFKLKIVVKISPVQVQVCTKLVKSSGKIKQLLLIGYIPIAK